MFAKIKKLLSNVWKNPYSSFYRQKYQKAGINLVDIKTIEDFQKLPFLTKAEIINSDPFERVFLPFHKIHRIGVTSGTTGGSPTVIFNNFHPLQVKTVTQKPIELGIKVIMSLGTIFSTQAQVVNTYIMGGRKKLFWLLGDITNLPLTAKVMVAAKISAITASPTALYHSLPHLKKELNLSDLKYIWLVGEICSDEKVKFFKKIFKNAYFFFNYSLRETGTIGYRCEYLYDQSPRFYHPNGLFYLEIINEELILTHLFTQTGFPLIRYRTGDSARLTITDCPCGNKDLLELMGRIDYDVVSIGGAKMYASEVDKVLRHFHQFLSSLDWKIRIFEKVTQSNITYKIKLQLVPNKRQITKEREVLKDQIATTVSEKLRVSVKYSLMQLIEKGIFSPLEVEFVTSFPAEAKFKRFIIS